MSTIRSFSTRRPRIGSTVTLGATSRTRTLHARALRPLISMASEPQIPCAQDRRRARVPSWYHFTWWRASSRRSMPLVWMVNSSHQGSARTSGLNRLIRSVSSIGPSDASDTRSVLPLHGHVGPELHVLVLEANGSVRFTVGQGVLQPVVVVAQRVILPV